MGFLKSCLDFIAVACATIGLEFNNAPQAFANFGLNHANYGGNSVDLASRIGSYPKIQPRDCRYPELEAQGYRHCNEEDRRCWLRRPRSPNVPAWTVGTDCEFLLSPVSWYLNNLDTVQILIELIR
jgi:hypothetical protein